MTVWIRLLDSNTSVEISKANEGNPLTGFENLKRFLKTYLHFISGKHSILCGSFIACCVHYKCKNLVFTMKYLSHIRPWPLIVPLQKCSCQRVLIIIRNQHVKAQLNRTWIFKGDPQVFLHTLCWRGQIRDIFSHFDFPQLSCNYLQRDSGNADSASEVVLCASAYSENIQLIFQAKKQYIKELVRAGNIYKAVFFPANSDSRQAKPVNNGDCPTA